MSNIGGKTYAMNVLTPVPRGLTYLINKLIFWAIAKLTWWKWIQNKLLGLITLSLIHYARWAIVRDDQFPHLDPSQPREKLKYPYMFFFSNFNGSWTQYVDSFSMAIPAGLDLLWRKNVKWPNSVPLQPFHKYITFNQIWTDYYYIAYPMAASNDVKKAQDLKDRLSQFIAKENPSDPAAFKKAFNSMLFDVQHDLGQLAPTPIVSLSARAVEERRVDRANTGGNHGA